MGSRIKNKVRVLYKVSKHDDSDHDVEDYIEYNRLSVIIIFLTLFLFAVTVLSLLVYGTTNNSQRSFEAIYNMFKVMAPIAIITFGVLWIVVSSTTKLLEKLINSIIIGTIFISIGIYLMDK